MDSVNALLSEHCQLLGVVVLLLLVIVVYLAYKLHKASPAAAKSSFAPRGNINGSTNPMAYRSDANSGINGWNPQPAHHSALSVAHMQSTGARGSMMRNGPMPGWTAEATSEAANLAAFADIMPDPNDPNLNRALNMGFTGSLPGAIDPNMLMNKKAQ
jgi:hypothetical protein